MAYEKGYYGDPSNVVDRIRSRERKTAPTCEGCRHFGGRLWGIEVCSIDKKRYDDGYCWYMDKTK